MEEKDIFYGQYSLKHNKIKEPISSINARLNERNLTTKLPRNKTKTEKKVLDSEIKFLGNKEKSGSAFNNFFFTKKAITKNDKLFENNLEYLLFIIYKAENPADFKNLNDSFEVFKLITKKKLSRHNLDRVQSLNSSKDDSNVEMWKEYNKNNEEKNMFERNNKREITFLKLEKLENYENDDDTDNSFIKNKINHNNTKAKKYLLEYKKRIQFYFREDQKEEFKKPYCRLLYLPLLIKMTRDFISSKFEYQEHQNPKIKLFAKEFKIIFSSAKEKKSYTYNFEENKNLEIFLDKFQRLAFCELLNTISQNELTEENVKYKTTKIIFTRLYNNLRNTKVSLLPEYYRTLCSHLVSLLSVKSKNFYLQDSLGNKQVDRNSYRVRGSKGFITIINPNLLHTTKINSLKLAQIKSGVRSPGTILPFSFLRLIWDFLIALCVIYNVIFIPFYFIETNYKKIFISFNDIFEMLIDGFTFLDIVLNFRTGYVDAANNIVMEIDEIKRNYVYTWFFWDIFSTFPWEVLFFGSKDLLMNLLKLPRVLRVNRLIKLSEKLNLRLIKLIILLVIFFLYAHWIGCFFYMMMNSVDILLSFSQSEQSSCLSYNVLGQNDFNTSCKYFFSLYNGMQILNSENLNIHHTYEDVPLNSFLIISYILGQLAFSVLIGLISSSIKYFDKANYRYLTKLRQINEHLEYNNISGKIRDHVNIYYDYIWKTQKDIIMRTDSVFQMTDIIKQKITAMSFRYIIPKLDFIKGDDIILGKVLDKLRKKIIMPYQIIFFEGEVTEGLYILASGKVFFEVRCLEEGEKEKYLLTIPIIKNSQSNNNASYVLSSIQNSDKNLPKEYASLLKENNFIIQSDNKDIDILPQNVNKNLQKSVTCNLATNSQAKELHYQKNDKAKTLKLVQSNDKKIIIQNINNVININNSSNTNIQVNIIENNSNFDSNTEFRRETGFIKSNIFESKLSGDNIFTGIEKSLKTKFYFDLISVMTASSRHWCTSYSNDFCELAFIKFKDLIQIFEENKVLFENLLREAKLYEIKHEIFSNENIFKLISTPSSRTKKSLYRKGNLTFENIWLEQDYFQKQTTLSKDYRMEWYRKDQDRINNLIN